MNVVRYLFKIRNLMNLKRYQNMYLFKQRSVAEHSWSVSKIAQSLAYVEMMKYENVVDMGILLQKTLSHDELEVITGDILSHSKRRTPAMKRAVASLEKTVFHEEYVQIIPKEWKESFQSFTLNAKDDTIEGHILHASDVIDTLFEAVEEIKLGNKEYFLDVLRNSIERLLDTELKSVKDFLINFLTSLEQMDFNLVSHYGEEFVQKIENWKKENVVEA